MEELDKLFIDETQQIENREQRRIYCHVSRCVATRHRVTIRDDKGESARRQATIESNKQIEQHLQDSFQMRKVVLQWLAR